MVELILPLSFAMSLLTYGLIAKWYVMPIMASIPRSSALMPLLLFHSTRHIGMAFLILGVTSESLDPRFANPAAYGDLLAAVLALIAIAGLRLRWAVALPLVWIFNIEGTADLLNALFQGFRYVPSGQFGAMYFIPTVVVPALLVTHFLVFWLLLRPEGSTENA